MENSIVVLKAWMLIKWSMGKQYISAADSVSANIAEGFGRYYKKEKIQFYRYSYGSLQETKDWTQKQNIRSY